MCMGRISFFVLWAIPLFVLGQSNIRSCDKVRTGTFYFYPATNKKGFVISRKKDVQSEINLTTSDTSIWRISWKNKCDFTLTFISKTLPLSSEDEGFYRAHTIAVRVMKVAKDYYVFQGGIDSIDNSTTTTDTLWFRARVN